MDFMSSRACVLTRLTSHVHARVAACGDNCTCWGTSCGRRHLRTGVSVCRGACMVAKLVGLLRLLRTLVVEFFANGVNPSH